MGGLSLKAESWTWYGFVVVVVLFRFTSRWMALGGFKKLQVEDFLMGFVLCVYTSLIVSINIVAFTNTNLMMPSDIPTLTPESIRERVYGSKLVLLVEQCMISTQWGCKICLLLLYSKLTFGLNQQLAVKIVAIYVVLAWLIMEILYFSYWCRPFSQYWAVPVSNPQCSTALHHLILNAVFNISSDLMMLCIAMPLLIRSHFPLKRKLVLCILFSLGCFTILCAALNKYYSFTEPFATIWTFWYVREASTAVLVANMPNCWPLVRRILGLRAFFGVSLTTGSGTAAGGSGSRAAAVNNNLSFEHGGGGGLSSSLTGGAGGSRWSGASSSSRIVAGPLGRRSDRHDDGDEDGEELWITKSFDVRHDVGRGGLDQDGGLHTSSMKGGGGISKNKGLVKSESEESITRVAATAASVISHAPSSSEGGEEGMERISKDSVHGPVPHLQQTYYRHHPRRSSASSVVSSITSSTKSPVDPPVLSPSSPPPIYHQQNSRIV